MHLLPKPAEEEFALGYLGRLAHLNSAKSANVLLRDLAKTFGVNARSANHLTIAAKAAGLSGTDLLRAHTLAPAIVSGQDVLKGRLRSSGGMPATAGWGLLDARDGKPINPVDFVSDELIEVSDWELQDFGVQIVRDHLQGQGKNVFNTQSNPQVNPSIWFDGPDGPEWVVVRVSRHPATKAVQPVNMADISHHCATHGGKQGYFASVVFANADDPFDPLAAENGNFIPVYRGHRAMVRFEGLEPISLERRFPSSKLCAELLSWNNALLKRGDDLPKVFSGICPDNRQFMVFMADLPIERGEHLDFMKAVLAAESAIAFCYSMHIMAKVGEGPDDLEERRDFVAGEAGHYEYVSARLVEDDAREQIGLEVVTHRESEEPEWFLQALLEAGQETERYQELWRGIRDKVKWRTR